MSYALSTQCPGCLLKDQCTDRHVIQGAIFGVHNMPYGVGHLGAGTITLTCHNLVVNTIE